MRVISIIGIYLLLNVVSVWAQAPTGNRALSQPISNTSAPTAFHVVGQGADHRMWQSESVEHTPAGKTITHVRRYVELASGLNYQDPVSHQWVPSQELIEPFSGGAIARHGQSQIIFANNLNSPGAIDQQTPDGKRLTSNILGLMYTDPSTGQAVLIAHLQDSEGQLVAANQILYKNAFDGVKANVLYTYRRDGMEQDVILREQPPKPEAFGMSSATTELAVITEFVNAPEARVDSPQVDATGTDADQTVSWGVVRLGHGKAFMLNGQDVPATVFKRYSKVNGHDFLLEKVKLQEIQSSVSALPLQASNARRLPGLASTQFVFPKAPTAKRESRPVKLALDSKPDQGYVLDYTTLNSSTSGNYTFQGDTTYYISGAVNLNYVTIEGGTVIKFSSTNSSSLTVGGQLFFTTAPYRPAVFTISDDNTVGETISGSTGTPVKQTATGNQANAIYFDGLGQVSAHDLRVKYVYSGLTVIGEPAQVKDCQFLSVWQPAVMNLSSGMTFENVLIDDADLGIRVGNGHSLYAVNLTAHKARQMFMGNSAEYHCTNSLFINITNMSSFSGCNNVTNFSDAGIFQSVGGGNFYLATNSPYRGAGTTNIDPLLLADLAAKTTYPPTVVYTPGVYFSANTSLSPQAQRDTNSSPDLGYHYDPLDYIFGPTYITNSTITIAPGTAVGIFGSNLWMYGFAAANNGGVVSQGLANNLNRIVEYNTVQESTPAGWKVPSQGMVTHFNGTNSLVNCQFTDWSALAQEASHFYTTTLNTPMSFQNCQFHGGILESYQSSISLTNCLLERVNTMIYPSDSTVPSFRNNTFWNGTFDLEPEFDGAVIYDNLFDGTIIPDGMGESDVLYTGANNAYVTNCNTLDPTAFHDMILASSPAYQTSWYGNYYLPTNSWLIDAGSAKAGQVGLYHFTTQTNQVPEGNSWVDIGYHYVATDAYGNPLDTNGDGIPDYLEDSNGNGVFDAGDLGNWLISPYNGLSGANVLNVYTPLK